MDVKVGDVVHVRGTVVEVDEGAVNLALKVGSRWYSRDDIFHVEPRPPEPIKVGDKVKAGEGCPGEGRVVAIHNEWAWLELSPSVWGCTHGTYSLSALARIDEAPAAPQPESKFGFTVGETVIMDGGVRVGPVSGKVVGFGHGTIAVKWANGSMWCDTNPDALRHGA